MTGAMYSAISGMQTHMTNLNVIGNNVANVNTYGYKAARTTFQESLYSTVRGGSNGNNAYGGVNPSQLGYGVGIGTIDLDMSTKNYVPTGVSTDLMIDGDGFFYVGPKPEYDATSGSYEVTDPSNLLLTRVGNFHFDDDGFLVDGGGNVVYGFVTCAGSGTKDTKPGAADYDNPLVSTQLVPIRLPLAALDTHPDLDAGDAIYPGVDGTPRVNIYESTAANTAGKPISVQNVTIDGKSGKITAYNTAAKEMVCIGYIPLANVSNPNGVTHISGAYYQALEGAGDSVPVVIGGADDLVGEFLNNGTAATDTQIFSAGTTQIVAGGLESSGTDIATEFSNMITTQRGYQANTRIITVTDSMLEELVNIKR